MLLFFFFPPIVSFASFACYFLHNVAVLSPFFFKFVQLGGVQLVLAPRRGYIMTPYIFITPCTLWPCHYSVEANPFFPYLFSYKGL